MIGGGHRPHAARRGNLGDVSNDWLSGSLYGVHAFGDACGSDRGTAWGVQPEDDRVDVVILGGRFELGLNRVATGDCAAERSKTSAFGEDDTIDVDYEDHV